MVLQKAFEGGTRWSDLHHEPSDDSMDMGQCLAYGLLRKSSMEGKHPVYTLTGWGHLALIDLNWSTKEPGAFVEVSVNINKLWAIRYMKHLTKAERDALLSTHWKAVWRSQNV